MTLRSLVSYGVTDLSIMVLVCANKECGYICGRSVQQLFNEIHPVLRLWDWTSDLENHSQPNWKYPCSVSKHMAYFKGSRDWGQPCCPSVQHEMGLILTRGGAQPKAHKLKVRIGHMYLAVPRLSQTKFLNYDPAMSYTAEFRAMCASHQI